MGVDTVGVEGGAMTALEVFNQNDGEVTKSFYAELNTYGFAGQLGVALFRAQKRSSRAKDYHRGKWRRAAYDVKEWSLSEVSRILSGQNVISWGWKQDPDVLFGEEPSHVLYVDLPGFGQCSFHSPTRGSGPDYQGEWDGQHNSAAHIIQWCDAAMRAGKAAEVQA